MIVRRFFPVLALCACALGQQYTISTFAGNGTAGFTGDGSNATDAQMNAPGGVAIDSAGNVYVADQGNHRIRMISKGTITTVAGNGTPNYSGDKASATAATLYNPSSAAIDSSGNLYIADTGNHAIRKVASGTITTVTGIGFGGYQGDNGLAAGAVINAPTGVAVDSAGNLFIADSNNNLIRRVSTAGIITTYVGAGATANRLSHPTAIALDSAGALYIADTNNRRIAKFAGNVLSTLAGNGTAGFSGDGGLAIRAMLNNPAGVAVDATGSVYIADTSNGRIRKVTPDGNISTIAGKGVFTYSGDGGPATSAGLYFPRGVAVDSAGRVYISDTNNNAIRLLEPTLPTISANGVVNASSFTASLSPGSLASVFGTGFATTTSAPDAPLPTIVNGVSVNVNGRPAPILYLTPTQINFQVPWTAAIGTANITVALTGTASNAATVPMLRAAPGLYLQANGDAIAQNYPDYSLNSAAAPAPAGGTIIVYLNGSGPVTSPVADGVVTPSTTLFQATSNASARIGTTAASVSFAGLTPAFIALTQANITIPAGTPAGSYPLTVTIDGVTSNPGTIYVK